MENEWNKSLIEVVLKTLHELGGCDAKNEYTKGWDDAINTAYEEISKLELKEDNYQKEEATKND